MVKVSRDTTFFLCTVKYFFCELVVYCVHYLFDFIANCLLVTIKELKLMTVTVVRTTMKVYGKGEI